MQQEMLSPNLSGYLRFFQILQELEAAQKINQIQKKTLKHKLTTKDLDLMHIVSTSNDDEDLKHQLILYLGTLSPMHNKVQRSKSSALSPCKRVKGDDLITQTMKQIDNLTKLLSLIMNEEDNLLDVDFFEKLKSLIALATEVNGKRDSFVLDSPVVSNILTCYKQMKQRYSKYMNSLLMLMDENVSPQNIYEFIDSLLFQLLGCKSYEFILMKDLRLKIYSSEKDAFRNVDLSRDSFEEIFSIEKMVRVSELKFLRKEFKESDDGYLIRLNDHEYFVLNQGDRLTQNFITLSLQYNYFESLQNFCHFVSHTISQVKVSYFSTLSIGDALLESGLDLVRCSKYVLVEQIVEELRSEYHVESMMKKHDESTPMNHSTVVIRFKDAQHSLELHVKKMDLSNSVDLRIYDAAQTYYMRYCQFLKQCYERIASYKFFLRSKNLTMIEFDKSGHLQFLSKAISAKIKGKYQMQFENKEFQQQSYQKMFENNPQMLIKINNYIQEKHHWKMNEEENMQENYELFIKREESQFKGFTIIFKENEWTRQKTQPPLQRQMRQQMLQSETLDYIKKLEEFNPDIRNSVVAMYMPQKESEIEQKFVQKTPTLLFRKLNKEQVIGKNSFFFKQREEERKNMQLSNPYKLNENHLVEKITDNIIDQLEFNTFDYKSKVEKSRIAWSILNRNNFINTFAIPLDKLINFLNELEQQYNQHDNPFHNYDHGISVMQQSHFILRQIDIPQLNNQIRFCLILSALCHDVAHTGRTNTFEANSLSILAIRYHDKVILEQHHAATTIKILKDQNTNILINFSDSEFKSFRKQLIHNILSTDMQEHFKMLKEFESRITTFNYDKDDIQLLCGMITHTSDFNGSARKWPLSKVWSEKINQEYRAQYEEEGRRGFPQQVFMKDLDKIDVMAKNEIGFIKVIVRPLYNALNIFNKGILQNCVDNIDETILEWDKIFQAQEQL